MSGGEGGLSDKFGREVIMLDTQQMELIGRHRLIEHLLQSGIEVAMPYRDRGVDIVIYWNTEADRFVSFPVQLKVSSGRGFSLARKYATQPNLVLIYAWQARDSEHSTMLAMSYRDALGIACDQGYTRTSSWIDRHAYGVTNVGRTLAERLNPFVVKPETWREASRLWFFDAMCAVERFRDGDTRSGTDLRAWLVRQGVPVPGEWKDWQKEADEFLRSPPDARTSDRQQVRRILTVHHHRSGGDEAYWARLAESGELCSLIEALWTAPLE